MNTSDNSITNHVSNSYKSDADKLIEIFKQHGIDAEIRTIR